ncbi:hypothetical protein B0H10DRAFT_2229999 [Mycena sp. CBHHK59/15]|nr:hypothetical protein B0H10DRAFT_2229999 [Mycena sp. CBHHK59/15]
MTVICRGQSGNYNGSSDVDDESTTHLGRWRLCDHVPESQDGDSGAFTSRQYDKALVVSWRSDMEGTLIFVHQAFRQAAGGAYLTYKTLTPDSGDAPVLLFTQISQQLSAAANGTAYHRPDPLHPLQRNDLLHRADMRSAPIIRARMFSHLYYAVKRFRLHLTVAVVPPLFHAALRVLHVFAGEVVFPATGPAYTAVVAVAAVLLWPCIPSPDVSGLRIPHTVLQRTLGSARQPKRSHSATDPEEDPARDSRALLWTAKSWRMIELVLSCLDPNLFEQTCVT